MASRVKGTVTGDKEIIANMRRVYASVGGAALDDNLSTALIPMKEETEDNARRLRQVGYNPPGGHLDEGVVIKKVDARGRFFRVYWLSFAKRARKIAHLVEFGTAPHWQPRRKIHHPGARAKPFARPAFESTKSEVMSEISANVWRQISTSILRNFKR